MWFFGVRSCRCFLDSLCHDLSLLGLQHLSYGGTARLLSLFLSLLFLYFDCTLPAHGQFGLDAVLPVVLVHAFYRQRILLCVPDSLDLRTILDLENV